MKRRWTGWLLVGILAGPGGLTLSSAAPAATIRVDLEGAGDFTEIQPAIDAAQDGDTVLVAPGEYGISEGINFNRLRDPQTPEGPPAKDISLIGAEGPDETILQAVPFVLIGPMILFENGESRGSLVEGFTLRGAGIACWNASSPTLRNLVVEDSRWRGAAVDCREGASPRVEGCKLLRNPSWSIAGHVGGGGVICENSSPSFADCEFLERSGIGIEGDSEVTVTRSTFSRSGIGTRDTSVLNLTGSKFLAAGVGLRGASATLTDCVIAGSEEYLSFSGNGVWCAGGSANLRNCTVVDNGGLGVAVSGEGTVARLVNCIVWDNEGGDLAVGEDATVDVSYSCIDQELPAGTANIRDDPKFCRGETVTVESSEELRAALWRVYSLSSQSPCIGRGEGGVNIGADLGICESAGGGFTRIQLAEGSYTIRSMDIIPTRTSLVGAGEDLTRIEGENLLTLRAGSSLRHLTLAMRSLVSSDESVEIAYCTILKTITLHRSSPLLDHCTIRTFDYGIRCEFDESPTLQDCLLEWNVLALSGSGRLTRCVIRDNIKGLSLEFPDSFLESCVITGNQYSGVYCGWGNSIFKNCLFTGNGGAGGEFAAAVDVTGSPVFMNCTLSGNTVGFTFRGFGVPSPTVVNCIAWGNSDESIRQWNDATEPIVAYSCIEGAEIWPGESNTNQDPLFARPGQFDFSRLTAFDDMEILYPNYIIDAGDYRLQPGSPALDRGTPDDAPSSDLAGNSRPCGDGVDMGAYESDDCTVTPPSFLRGDCNDDGAVDISDAVTNLGFLFLGGSEPGCDDACDSNDDGVLDISDPISTLGALFLGNVTVPLPGMIECGVDPTEDSLSCQTESCS